MRAEKSREIAGLLDLAEKGRSCLAAPPGPLRRALDVRVRAGELVSPKPRLYARAAYWGALDRSERTRHELRALHELHPEWVFCGPSAAVLLGLWVSHRLQGTVHLAVPRASGARSHGLVRRHALASLDVADAQGVPVTSPEQTVVDCARWLSLREGLAVTDSALRLGACSQEKLEGRIERMDRRCRGLAQARMTVAHASPLSENGGESIARAAMWELGFMTPELQVEVPNPFSGSGFYRVDFRWRLPDGTVIYGEHDGTEKYVNPLINHGSPLSTMKGERRRESALTVGHASVVRFSPADVADAPYFDWLLSFYGVPKDHEPIVRVPPIVAPEALAIEVVPVEAYGLR